MEPERKKFDSPAMALAAERAERFIEAQTSGAGTWPDRTDVPIGDIVPGAMLRVIDIVGPDNGGPKRHIQLLRAGAVIVTFAYDHSMRQLIQTF